MAPLPHVGRVIVPEETEAKLRQLRNLTGEYVRAAVEWPAAPVRAWWEQHPVHGERLLMLVRAGGRYLKVILEPVDVSDGTWRLKTCILTDRADITPRRRA